MRSEADLRGTQLDIIGGMLREQQQLLALQAALDGLAQRRHQERYREHQQRALRA